MAVEVKPLGECPFLRACQLDFLNAGEKVVFHTVELRLVVGKLQLLVVHLHKINYEQYSVYREHHKRRNEQLLCIYDNLEHIDHSEEQSEEGTTKRLVGKGTQTTD